MGVWLSQLLLLTGLSLCVACGKKEAPAPDASATAPTTTAEPPPVDQPNRPSVVWEGQAQGDGTGPQMSYFVRLYANQTAHCQCPDFYFRATLRRDANYACKHIRRALSAMRQP